MYREHIHVIAREAGHSAWMPAGARQLVAVAVVAVVVVALVCTVASVADALSSGLALMSFRTPLLVSLIANVSLLARGLLVYVLVALVHITVVVVFTIGRFTCVKNASVLTLRSAVLTSVWWSTSLYCATMPQDDPDRRKLGHSHENVLSKSTPYFCRKTFAATRRLVLLDKTLDDLFHLSTHLLQIVLEVTGYDTLYRLPVSLKPVQSDHA